MNSRKIGVNISVETEIEKGSPTAGKSVADAGLRSLSGNFLVEIVRKSAIIRPVSPDHILRIGDRLIFTGETESIKELNNPDLGLSLPKECNSAELSDVVEVVVSYNSWLVGRKINERISVESMMRPLLQSIEMEKN